MNKSDWIINTAGLVMDLLPGFSYDDAKPLAEDYLTDAGGWVPDDGGEPVGEGAPDSGETPDEAALEISLVAIGDTNTVQITVPVSVTMSYTGSLPTGTSTADIVNAGKTSLQNAIAAQLAGSGFEYNEVVWADAATTSRFGGSLGQAARAAVQAEILANVNLVDPAAVAVSHVRYHYGLGDTWMTYKLYTREDHSIVAWIRKYTTNTYTTEDTFYVDGEEDVTYAGYLVYLHPVNLKVQSVLTYPKEVRTPST